MAGGAIRVSIPANTREMIQSIKDITRNDSEDEILAMLEECGMDPDETIQRLLLLDPFHEVKRKRDKKKENFSNKDFAESRWRSGTQGRGNRGGRMNSFSRYASQDAGDAKTSSKRENGNKQVSEKAADPLISTSQEIRNNESVPVSSIPTLLTNGSTGVPSGSYNVQHASDSPAIMGQPKPFESPIGAKKPESASYHVDTNKNHGISLGSGDMGAQLKPTGSSEVHFSSSNPLCGTAQTPREQHVTENKFPSKSRGIGKTHFIDSSELSRPTSANSNNSGSRPSSNYSSCSQQMIGPLKTGSIKEWKPKQVNLSASIASGASSASEIPVTNVEASDRSPPVSDVPSEEAKSEVQRKLEDLHLPQRQHVIIPNHIQVPESARTKFSFGSFDAGFGLTSSCVTAPENKNSSAPLSQTSLNVEETLKEGSSKKNSLETEKEGDYPDKSELPPQVPEELSVDGALSTHNVQELNETKKKNTLMSGNNQNSGVRSSTNYNFGSGPPVLGSQISALENAETQSQDVSRVPSFVVQQPFDPASYYAQFYRSSPDTDGRVSPFMPLGFATKYNGNVTVLPQHTSQSTQESGNSVLATAIPSPPPVTLAAGLMPSSIAVTQQPFPVFRPPAGMHISHYPSNYVPFGYFAPFYVPPPTIHQFLSNGAFAQQPQAGSVYPALPPNAAAGVKYSVPQYKTGTNTGNFTHIGMPSGYGPYGSFSNFNHESATSAGNSALNEDLNSSQSKESNAYSTGQQSEASPVWIAGVGRDVAVNSFYNVPPPGQHVAFAPTQAAPGTFFHPAQAAAASVHPLLQQSQPMAGAVDMVGPTTNVYQQPPQTQINWPSNY